MARPPCLAFRCPGPSAQTVSVTDWASSGISSHTTARTSRKDELTFYGAGFAKSFSRLLAFSLLSLITFLKHTARLGGSKGLPVPTLTCPVQGFGEVRCAWPRLRARSGSGWFVPFCLWPAFIVPRTKFSPSSHWHTATSNYFRLS